MARLIDADALMAHKFKNDISYNAFCSLVKRQPTVNQWRRVEEPPKDGLYGKLVCDTEGQISICGGYATVKLQNGSVVYTYSRLFDVFKEETDNWNLEDITHFTHWMLLPEAPKEKEDDKAGTYGV